jgi:hypothetical protein
MADVQRHLDTLSGPDVTSKDRTRDPAATGARIVQVPNGWRVLNLEWYREEAKRQGELARKRRWWNESGAGARRGARHTETETETETETQKDPDPVVMSRSVNSGRVARAEEASTSLRRVSEPELETIKLNPNRGRFVPDSWHPTDRHLVRCQELRMDPKTLLASFRLQEFNRDYSDWNRRFSKWIEDEKIRRETAIAAGKPVAIKRESVAEQAKRVRA